MSVQGWTIMKSVFIETTIPSYLVARISRDIVQAARQELTMEWWSAHRRRYKLFTSQIVLDEVGRGERDLAKKRVELLTAIPLLDIHDIVIRLAEDLVAKSVLPQKDADDALHIACAAAHRMDFLLTWNCRHIANPHNQRGIRACLAEQGFEMPVICTPEELIEDEN